MIQHIDIIPVDLEKGLVRDNIGYILATGDKRGNRIGVEVKQGGTPKELSRCTATGYFIRPTGETVVIPGTVEGSTAYVDLPDTCYVAEGPFALAIKVASGSEEIGTLRVVDGYVRSTQTDAIIDPGTVIPSLSDLLAQIAVMEQAISDANAATRSAQEAAQAANTANQTVQDALARGDYDVKALQILGYYPDLPTLQSAVTRPKVGDVYGVAASAPYAIYVYSTTGWVNNGVLQGPAGQGIPTGGTTGQLLQKASETNYDTSWISISAITEAIEEAMQTSFLTKAYPIGSIYLSVNDTDPGTLFGGTWERIKDTFLLSAGDTYEAGTTGGEATHTLTEREMPAHKHASASNGKQVVTADVSDKEAILGTGTTLHASWTGHYVTGSAGSGEPHNIMPPYVAVYVWKRVS